MERELEYGNAILSQLPLTTAKTIFTRGEYRRNFDIMKDDGNIRNLQVVTVETKNSTLNILNHHGYHIQDSKLGDDETMRQMSVIADTVKDYKARLFSVAI